MKRRRKDPPYSHSGGLSKHHCLPRSKGGANSGNNIVMLSADIHQLWHKQWYNLLPTQIVYQICKVFFGFSEDQLRDVRFENFLDMVSSITEGKDRKA